MPVSLEALERHGFVDSHEHCAPGTQAHSWIGRTGDGYRYDYFHAGRELGGRIKACAYLHETREQRLTDHAAVTLTLISSLHSLNPQRLHAKHHRKVMMI